ncbi:MAG: anti-sigma F factor [Ruminococcaceae bacterium]|nr:anti-sigma F factor [Oscillospiraceae bacterium]
MKKHDKLKLEVESKSINEGFARAAVAAFAARLDPSMDELGDLKTAVSEAVTNCIVHAYPDSIGMIQILCRAFEDAIEIRVRDHGRGIPDIAKAREPLYTTGGEDRSGMGFTVMESFMDELRVRSRPGAGTTVTMTKRIRSRK